MTVALTPVTCNIMASSQRAFDFCLKNLEFSLSSSLYSHCLEHFSVLRITLQGYCDISLGAKNWCQVFFRDNAIYLASSPKDKKYNVGA